MPRKNSVVVLAPALLLFVASGKASAQQSPSICGLGSDVTSDFKYLAKNVIMDGEDLVTAPLYLAAPDSALRSPRFCLVIAAAGAIFGGSFALDQTMRSHLEGMSSGDADNTGLSVNYSC
jgi:hypothetical protein